MIRTTLLPGRRRASFAAWLFCCVSLGVGRASAQDGARSVTVEVTAASGAAVYLDQGRSAGLEPGLEVLLFPRQGATVRARVRSVSLSQARAELLDTTVAIPPGTRGTVQVHAVQPEASPQSTGASPPPPAHPPWEQPLTSKDKETPLLAPVAGRKPAERPTRLQGRVWTGWNNSWNRGRVDQRFSLADLGVDLAVLNPLQYGGSFHFRGDLYNRRTELDVGPDQNTTRGRLDRLSYRFGHSDDGPMRYQVGRFLNTLFPALGLVDGVEGDVRTGSGVRLGAALGGAPVPNPDQATFDDVQVALMLRTDRREPDAADLGIAWQKTWHRGAPDRDLLVLDGRLRPTESWSLYGVMWIDYYTASDTVKATGFELTELLLQSTHRFGPRAGAALTVSRIRWPELDRNEFTPATADLLNDARVLRVNGDLWRQFGDHLHTRVHGTWWEDQNSDGWSGDVRIGLRDLLFSSGEVAIELFRTEGAFQDGHGVRLSILRSSGSVSWSLGYELSHYEDHQAAIGAADFSTLQALNGGLRLMLSRTTDLNLQLDHRFGGAQDALTLGTYVQTRF
ncbi:MAG: hypothetical protein KDC87_03970 [Planctomycetes bacterium]|nr:hypothetical protein [Planctomycetota bacterium]MCB9870131.1 hypothetical protein [Planctomycetota bacterium]